MVQSYSPGFANVHPTYSTFQSTSAPYLFCPLLSSFEYIYISTAGHVARRSGLHLIYGSLGTRCRHPERHHDRSSRFCRDHCRETDRQTDYASPSAATGHIHLVLQYGLIIHCVSTSYHVYTNNIINRHFKHAKLQNNKSVAKARAAT